MVFFLIDSKIIITLVAIILCIKAGAFDWQEMDKRNRVINFNKSIIMEKDQEAEKLNIDPERLIHILLKHLMYLKNENAYLKNYVGIKSFENGVTEMNIGINNGENGIVENYIGINNSENGIVTNIIGINNSENGIVKNNNGMNNCENGIVENYIGINNSENGIAENIIGINNSENGIAKNNIGIKNGENDIVENNIGVNNVENGIVENNLGKNNSVKGTVENDLGIKSVFNALSALNNNANAAILLYTVFERGLIDALNQYIKNGNGQNTLYSYYTYFVEAVEKRNLAASKPKETAMNIRLEDTHILPQQITADSHALTKLRAGLHGHLPRTARWDLYENVARELLLLHNAGKATGTQLRNIAQLSVPGFAKHLPKLKRSGLIKKEPPSNYVLTEYSKHILLETFGIPKNN